ncbi:MAG: ORF6N domain-containing protein [Sphingobacteriaceae bacterium]|nr:ORF6N domain-containing protein [Sphingobacteriaceae bacterium]
MSKIEKIMNVPDEIIMKKIYLIRGQKVMLDKDLAELYGVATKVFNQAVKRNRKRFPEDFMFELTQTEFDDLRSQSVTSKNGRGGRRYLPLVFTEHGVAMLSSILNSDKAININIQIVRVFVRVRQMLFDNAELRLAIDAIRRKTDNNTKNIELVFQYLDELIEKKEKIKPRKQIGYKVSK